MKGQARQTILAGARLSDRKGLGLAVLPSLFSRLYGEVPNTVALIDSCARAAPPSGHINKDTVANVIRRANSSRQSAGSHGCCSDTASFYYLNVRLCLGGGKDTPSYQCRKQGTEAEKVKIACRPCPGWPQLCILGGARCREQADFR